MADAPVEVTVLYFGGLKEALGCAQEDVAVEPPQLTVLYEQLQLRHPRLSALLPNVRLALNEEFLPGVGSAALSRDEPLKLGDVVAFIPPVTGG